MPSTTGCFKPLGPRRGISSAPSGFAVSGPWVRKRQRPDERSERRRARRGSHDPAQVGGSEVLVKPMNPVACDPRAPLIVCGAGRSGSTLLTKMLAAHAALSFHNENNFLSPWLWRVVGEERF